MKIAVVIPIYKPFLKDSETASLRQVLSILRNYTFSFVIPKGIDISRYLQICNDYPETNIIYEEFDPKWFEDIKSYNLLCLSPLFYKKYIAFDYILIYQLDAWVFNDSLYEWCKKNYDYIGAPWIEYDQTGKEVFLVGNGGFSLRRVQYFIDLLKENNNIFSFKQWMSNCKTFKDYILFIPHILGYHANGAFFLSRLGKEINEDIIISKLLQHTKYPPRIPSYDEAISFAFECKPSLMYAINNNQLPFGCHAFEKWEFQTFWSKFIKI